MVSIHFDISLVEGEGEGKGGMEGEMRGIYSISNSTAPTPAILTRSTHQRHFLSCVALIFLWWMLFALPCLLC